MYESEKGNSPFANKVPMIIKVNIEFIMVLKKQQVKLYGYTRYMAHE